MSVWTVCVFINSRLLSFDDQVSSDELEWFVYYNICYNIMY